MKYAEKIGILLDSSKNIQIALLILATGVIAFGQIARWDLLDQIAMADRFYFLNIFYPNSIEAQPGGVSVYFPGVSFLAYLLGTLISSKYIVQAMLLLACVTTIGFLLLQQKIAKQIDNSYTGANFWPLAIIF